MIQKLLTIEINFMSKKASEVSKNIADVIGKKSFEIQKKHGFIDVSNHSIFSDSVSTLRKKLVDQNDIDGLNKLLRIVTKTYELIIDPPEDEAALKGNETFKQIQRDLEGLEPSLWEIFKAYILKKITFNVYTSPTELNEEKTEFANTSSELLQKFSFFKTSQTEEKPAFSHKDLLRETRKGMEEFNQKPQWSSVTPN